MSIQLTPSSSTSIQPLFGQTANIFGRRWLMITAVAIFALGSGISGGAKSAAMLIAGRAIQGIGGGGINVMIDIIISDLIPLRERGKFLGIIFSVFALGTSIGPFVGGIIVQRISWRWVFYLNLPIAGVSLVLLVAFLQIEYKRTTTIWASIKRIDFTGNAILTASIVSILIALSWGGTRYSWSSFHVIVPLVVGLAGTVAFHVFQASGFVAEPTMPPRLFTKRTTMVAFVLTFIHGMLTFWIIYFLPVYFQGVLGSSTTRSGVQLLPSVILAVPMAIVGGGLVTKFGRYRPLHFFGFGMITLGLGLFTLFDASTSVARWVVFQIIAAIGVGILLTTLLPAVQVELPESDVATATATFSFIKTYGSIWGISIPAAIFNTEFTNLAFRITDPTARAALSSGAAYSSVSRTLIESFGPKVANEIISVYSDSIKLIWEVAVAFAGLAFLLSFLEKEVKLRTELDTEYGLKEKPKQVDIEKTS